MDEQQPNNWEQWSMNRQDSSNSPYYNQPTHSPYLGQGFAVASLVFGILAMVSTCTVVAPFFFGGFSFLFGALAYRKGRKKNHMIPTGMAMAIVGIISSVVLVAQVFIKLPEQMQDPVYREQLENTFNALYGDTFDGMSFEDFMKQYYGIEF